LALGTVHHLTIESRVLQGNVLDDSTIRPLFVYVPHGYDAEGTIEYPTLYLLPSHGNSAAVFLNWRPWAETMPERLNRLMSQGGVPPAIMVMVDAWTRLGGSQYVNSAMGRYEDYLIHEIVPYVDAAFRTNGQRGILGHSSGGYGALVQAMRHPEVFQAVASHSGDVYWEYAYLPGITELHQALVKYGGAEAFIQQIPTIQPKGGTFWKTLIALCATMAHSDSYPEGLQLPIDMTTGALDETVWERWLTYDPLRMVDDPGHQAALRGMALVYLTAGLYDEYQLQVGARLLRDKLRAAGIDVLHEELPTAHSGAEVPYDRSIELLVKALA
jgi:predicted alpha/beta superfamily hydrolase